MSPIQRRLVGRPEESILRKIVLVRGRKVLFDSDLAALYGVTTSNLNKAVKRNPDRFPVDFMFQLTTEELRNLTFQSGTSRDNHGGRRTAPYVFTEEGVAMLSSVLRSRRAAMVNIEIMRAFVRFRSMISEHKELLQMIETLEKKYDKQFAAVFDALRQLMRPPEKPKLAIGFRTPAPEESAGTKKA